MPLLSNLEKWHACREQASTSRNTAVSVGVRIGGEGVPPFCYLILFRFRYLILLNPYNRNIKCFAYASKSASALLPFNLLFAWFKRDITVPIGLLIRSAISRYLSPSM